ncbi:hypothetical protein SCUP234_01076 [Seiridium cupressi]
MTDRMTSTINGPDGSIDVEFGEATFEQRAQCCKLAAIEFGAPLTTFDYLEREQYLGDLALTRNNGWRFWCLYLATNLEVVLATCKTIRRDIIVRDAKGVREERGYCIASVVTNPQFRGRGLASLLLEQIAAWIDGPGDAYASMLYTSIGDFYARRGWKAFPVSHCTMPVPAKRLPSAAELSLPKTQSLSTGSFEELCARDVDRLKIEFDMLDAESNDLHLAVLPTFEMISWLHERANYIALKHCAKKPQIRGAISQSMDAWVCWYHDFRKQQLVVQRLHSSIGSAAVEFVLSSILLEALREAQDWGLPRVVVWDSTPAILRASQSLGSLICEKVLIEEQATRSVPSLRLRNGTEAGTVTIHKNQFYAWS